MSPDAPPAGRRYSPDDVPSEPEDTPESEDPALDEYFDDMSPADKAAEMERRRGLRAQREARRAERRAVRRAEHARARENIAPNAQAVREPIDLARIEEAFAQVLRCTTPLDASKVGVSSQDALSGIEKVALQHRAPRLFWSVSDFCNPTHFNMRN